MISHSILQLTLVLLVFKEGIYILFYSIHLFVTGFQSDLNGIVSDFAHMLPHIKNSFQLETAS